MAKGHLLITPATRAQDDHHRPDRASCFRQFTITDGAILLSGIQLAVIVAYLLHLTCSYDADYFSHNVENHIYQRLYMALLVVSLLIFIVMLLVFGIVGRRLWMIVPSLLAQVAFVVAFIWGAVHLGRAVTNFDPENLDDAKKGHPIHSSLYSLKLYMALSIVGIILSLLCLVVLVLCFVSVFKQRNAIKLKEKSDNGFQ